MALVNSVQKSEFDTEAIHEGDLIYVEHTGWNEPRKGIVIHVSADNVTFLYHPEIANVTNRQDISAADVSSGGYVIRWTSDMAKIGSYGEDSSNDS